jgi:hypothetical protein
MFQRRLAKNSIGAVLLGALFLALMSAPMRAHLTAKQWSRTGGLHRGFGIPASRPVRLVGPSAASATHRMKAIENEEEKPSDSAESTCCSAAPDPATVRPLHWEAPRVSHFQASLPLRC